MKKLKVWRHTIFTPPPPVTNCHTFSDPPPPLERDILYGRPLGGSMPCFFIFVSRAWRRCLQPSPSSPHHSGLAYTIPDTMVAPHRWVPLSPWAISVLTAYKLWLLWVKILSTWLTDWLTDSQREHGKLNLPHTSPQNFHRAHAIPGAGSGMSPNLVLGRLTIIVNLVYFIVLIVHLSQTFQIKRVYYYYSYSLLTVYSTFPRMARQMISLDTELIERWEYKNFWMKDDENSNVQYFSKL